ncbi:hypothetical protein ANN_04648 [Periplaneta americana]|uniref:Uncharacterized protein n=1 Tax=Periplaneta americana TaxID=6978 RepID=A0ABQ8TAY4_PERAM|nr:hypothetical protein ANN_04648 [Periplaneta americana]
MTGLCEGGNEPPGSLKASKVDASLCRISSAEVMQELVKCTISIVHSTLARLSLPAIGNDATGRSRASRTAGVVVSCKIPILATRDLSHAMLFLYCTNDGQRDGRKDGQRDGRTDGRMDTGRTDGRADRLMERETETRKNEWTDRWTEGRTERRTDGHTNRQTDEQGNRQEGDEKLEIVRVKDSVILIGTILKELP